jgi:hypothetical protein
MDDSFKDLLCIHFNFFKNMSFVKQSSCVLIKESEGISSYIALKFRRRSEENSVSET